jgi:hypothetical protein
MAVLLSLWCSSIGADVAQPHQQEVLGAPTLQRGTCYWKHPIVYGLSSGRQTTGSSMTAVDATVPRVTHGAQEHSLSHAYLPEGQYMQSNGPPICIRFLGRRATVHLWLPGGCIYDCRRQLVHSRRCPVLTNCTNRTYLGIAEADGRARVR